MSSNAGSRRHRNGRQNRERDIISTAARIIHTDGFSRLNVDDLAKKVGISKSTLYQHYDHKSDIILHALQFGVQSILHILDQADGTPLDRLEQLLRFLHRYPVDDESALAGIVFTEAMHMLHSDEAARQDVDMMMNVITKTIQEAKAMGEIRADIQDEVVSSTIFSLAIVLSSHPIPSPTNGKQETVDQLLAWWRQSLV
ncbi:TetR/AcrR family transcriptional regulator [Phototrophicus methaneseepsis]|uniref:TetR/AcrR family transcriptional regulator n=1 Tax=Phototrophicus methaneseepsis TaxID=2710758 RepID=A0A7S8EAU3_9CHLR|nr:TetR/AcrR family transcriptional regulator [Phototrophicus methaneseepsis]QPC83560.1 TetR/AcrR family transcriptional regulator [Phototrophicus methaneseepsis]